MRRLLLSLSLFFLIPSVWAQDSAKAEPSPTIKFTGFVDAYYAFDFNNPKNHEVSAPLIYNYRRHNEFNINLALVSAGYSSDKIRAKIGLMAGTYAQYNYAAEQELLKHVYEANAGMRLAKNIWFDAGIFASHIGNESAFSITNPTLTRSMMAENSPYYQTGAKITYDAGKKWLFSVLVLNGWQNIQETPDNSNKPVCTQITFRPTDKIELNSSTFIGNEKPDSAKQMRYFHHFYITTHFTPRIYLSAAFDYGIQERYKDKANFDNWSASSVILKIKIAPKVHAALRGEYYSDAQQVIVSTGTPYGAEITGTSLNFDFIPKEGALFRVEGKMFNATNNIFTSSNGMTNQAFILTTAFMVSF
ncbi:MAG: porin [Bacteroidia bacterium]